MASTGSRSTGGTIPSHLTPTAMTTTRATWRWPWAEAFRLVRRPRTGRRHDRRTARPPGTMRRRPHPRAPGHRCQWRSLRYRSQGRSTCCCGPVSTVGAGRDASVTGATPLTASLTKNGSRASTHRSVRYAISGTTGATCAGGSTGLRRRLMECEAHRPVSPATTRRASIAERLTREAQPGEPPVQSHHRIRPWATCPPFPDRALLLARLFRYAPLSAVRRNFVRPRRSATMTPDAAAAVSPFCLVVFTWPRRRWYCRRCEALSFGLPRARFRSFSGSQGPCPRTRRAPVLTRSPPFSAVAATARRFVWASLVHGCGPSALSQGPCPRTWRAPV